uniref:C-type lectin domain-containing protein n=1 Tax=Amphiprion ocellaris TaxID=80972 RepID=A0A3Q1CQ16_AMPOC
MWMMEIWHVCFIYEHFPSISLLQIMSWFCSCLHQYQFIDELKTWGEAQQYCREKFTDLATVDNMEDVAQLIAAAGSGYSGRVWIGLYDNSRKPGPLGQMAQRKNSKTG